MIRLNSEGMSSGGIGHTRDWRHGIEIRINRGIVTFDSSFSWHSLWNSHTANVGSQRRSATKEELMVVPTRIRSCVDPSKAVQV